MSPPSPSQPPILLKGSCQCSSITYTSTSLPTELGNCHCLICRKISGSPFITFAAFSPSDLTFSPPLSAQDGETSMVVTRYSDIAERGHCRDCGSTLWMRYHLDADKVFWIAAGSIDEGSLVGELPKIGWHIFTGKGEKAGWYDLPKDGVEHREGFAPSFQARIDEWRETNARKTKL